MATEEPSVGWTHETLLVYLTGQVEGVRQLTDGYWTRYLADREELGRVMEREDANLARQVKDLRRYHDDSMKGLERLLSATIRASDKAIAKSETSVDRRLEALGNSVSREEYLTAHGALVERVNALQSRIERNEGRGAGFNALWLLFVAAISTLGVIITVVILITGR